MRFTRTTQEAARYPTCLDSCEGAACQKKSTARLGETRKAELRPLCKEEELLEALQVEIMEITRSMVTTSIKRAMGLCVVLE